MSNIRILLLCSNRFALQTMQELAYFKQLVAIAIPEHCDEWIENAHAALMGMEVPILVLKKDTYIIQLTEAFETYDATIGLMITFSYKIPASVYSIPAKGFYNLHPGPLPAYRGPDPVFYQIKNREKLAGVAVHVVDEKFDNGAIVLREMIRLLPTDTYGLLSLKLSVVGTKLIHNLVKLLSYDLPLPLKPQDNNKASYHKKQLAKDVSINWERMEATEIVALINACNPWNKGASTRLGNRIMRFLEASAIDTAIYPATRAGTIVAFNNADLAIACINNTGILVTIISTDEGVFNAARLKETGVIQGHYFESIA